MDDIQYGRMMRLNELLNALNIKNITFAKALKTNPGFVSQLLNGHRKLTTEFSFRISNCYPKVNASWLISGEGEMFLSGNGKESKVPEAGVLTGVMEPEPPAYVRGEGRLEWLERKVRELEDRVKRLTTHVGRHTFGFLYLLMGGKVEELREIMGHSKLETTMIYTHTDHDRKVAGVRRFDEVFRVD